MTEERAKPRLFDTPFDFLLDKEKARLEQEAARVIDQRPISPEMVAVRSVGVVGDAASYDPTLFLNLAPKHEFSVQEIGALSTKIINEVKGIGRVMLDITPLAKRD